MTRPWERRRGPRVATLARSAFRWLVTFVLALAVFAGAAWLLAQSGQRAAVARQQIAAPASAAELAQEDWRLRRIAAALEIYRLREGHWPERLEALVDTRLLAPEELAMHKRHRAFHYRPAGEAYVLLPPAY